MDGEGNDVVHGELIPGVGTERDGGGLAAALSEASREPNVGRFAEKNERGKKSES